MSSSTSSQLRAEREVMSQFLNSRNALSFTQVCRLVRGLDKSVVRSTLKVLKQQGKLVCTDAVWSLAPVPPPLAAAPDHPSIVAQKQAIKLLNELMVEHGLVELGWRSTLDRAKARGGQCRYKHKVISLSRVYVSCRPLEEVRNTCLHEIAHALCGHKAGHGSEWKAKALSIGCDGLRCLRQKFTQGRFLITCPCGKYQARRHRVVASRWKHRVCAECRGKLVVKKTVSR